ncbi:Signal transduction histidine kinase [Chitinispirillum alkaliphilum]|nr:Signal transduction histidine kinase [Chitinispirillum alkaliphilum]
MSKDIFYFLIAIILSFLVFLLDILLGPQGYVEWVLYSIPLVVVYNAKRIAYTYLILGLSTVLLYLAMPYSLVYQINPTVSLINRSEGLITFLIFSFIINNLIKARHNLEQSNLSLQSKTEELSYLNKELESFSYSVSHDLRTPLSTIKGFGDIIIEDHANTLDKEVLDYVRVINSEAKKMGQLINDMLRLSRVSRTELNPEELDLTEIITSIVDELRQKQPHKKVTVRIEENLSLIADKNLLQIALSNLLNNAWKYSSKNDKAVIEVGKTEINGKTTYFVRDNGVGFDQRRASELFIPFNRLHSQQEFKGTGVGLSIVSAVIKRHGGEIWAEGKRGKGAVFYFTIPRRL